MKLSLPNIVKTIYESNGNKIYQYFQKGTCLEDFEILNTSPFIIQKDKEYYLLTSDINDPLVSKYNNVILTSKKPTNKNILTNELTLLKWLRNPLFTSLSPDQVLESWKGNFLFKKENEASQIKGLRPPQIGALHSILAHVQNPDDRAIIVMPTGTGKTETMLSALIANECKRLLVSVPSDSLRTQISEKFITLGLLKEFGIINLQSINPIVGVMNSGFKTNNELVDFITKCNVVISTMDILTDCTIEQKIKLNEHFSHFFVDEAHHSEAKTWKELIGRFDREKVFLFTATPYRNDGKSLQGKVIFNFSLRKAQEQKYYKKINYLPIREYSKDIADEQIANKAVEQLKLDLEAGFDHIVMARCMSKVRAQEVFEYYKKYTEYNPILIYTGISGLSKKIEAIKKGNHKIIVCVNMLGEGFDLPNLKIAAVHDERQSLPITLQFIGRFTRTSYNKLGNASFITNIAYPPILEELDQLYARNADWNLLLPRMSNNATQREINIKEFLDRFQNINNSEVPFGEINPAMSTIIYNNTSTIWSPNNWDSGFQGIDGYEHVFSDHNHTDTLIIILGKIEKVDWGTFETVQNLQWDLVVIHWDLRPNINRVFINTSLKSLSSNLLMNSLFGKGKTFQITGMNVFRIFHDVNRLSLYNVGTRRGIGQDISFQAYYGKGVQDGIKELEQGTLIKNNIFGTGYKEGEKISLGCSVKGKIWSYQRGNLDELTKWCREIGEIVENTHIDPNVVLQHTLSIEKIESRPLVMPILVDWNHSIYEAHEERFSFIINGKSSDLSFFELSLVNPSISGPLSFSLKSDENTINFDMELGIDPSTKEKYFQIIKTSVTDCTVFYGNKITDILDFFLEFPPIVWFADGSQLLQNLYVKLRLRPDSIPVDMILTDHWVNVNIANESQDIYPYVQDSIQYYFINKIKKDFQIVYDDDGSGEIADIIGINDMDHFIDIHLFHLKYANSGKVNNDIDNFYQVCGQAQKSLKWKYRSSRDFFNHLLKRKTKTLNKKSCNRIIKGTENDLEDLLNQAKYSKPIKFHIYIVQPSLSKTKASQDILLLLGSVHHYLSTVGNIELKVYSSI